MGIEASLGKPVTQRSDSFDGEAMRYLRLVAGWLTVLLPIIAVFFNIAEEGTGGIALTVYLGFSLLAAATMFFAHVADAPASESARNVRALLYALGVLALSGVTLVALRLYQFESVWWIVRNPVAIILYFVLLQAAWVWVCLKIKPQLGGWPKGRKFVDRAFLTLCLVAASTAVLLLAVLLISILWSGFGRLSWEFLTNFNSSTSPNEAGIYPALIGSLWLLLIVAVTSIPLGVGTAILLEEYRPKNRALRSVHGFIQTNITNLAGVPSIVYGILGVSFFATLSIFGLDSYLGTMNTPRFTIGQDWYNEYYDAAGNTYYTSADGRASEETPAHPDLVFYRTMDLDNVADVTVRPEESLQPIKQRIESDLAGIEDAIRAGISDNREGRRGPAEIGPKVAMEIAQKAFADTNLRAETEVLLGITVEELQKMDGKSGSELRAARRQLVNRLESAELEAAGVEGPIIEGALPQRRDKRAWYYFQVPFGRSVIAGGLTLMLVILPVIIVASQEAIRAVPQSVRHGSLALGGTKWQSISKVVLPSAIPGICTGAILAMSRAIGEAAPIIMLGAVLITYIPDNLMANFSAMPLQIYQWTAEPDEDFRRTAAAGIIVLLAVLLSFNAVAVFIRQRFQQERN